MTTQLDFPADTQREENSPHGAVPSEQGPLSGRSAGMEPAPIWFLLCVIGGLGLWLRLHALGARSLWIDEGVSAMIVRLPWSGFLALIQRREGNMALYYLVLRGWAHLGSSEFVIRALSALTGVLALAAIYLLGKRLFCEGAGILAALLLAVHAFHIRYSQEARSYSLVILLLLLSAYFLSRAAASDAARHWLLFVIFAALAVYAHFFAGLVVVAQIASLAFLPGLARLRRSLLRAMALLGGLLSPVAWYVYTHQAGVIDWIPALSWHVIYVCAVALTGSGGAALLLAYGFACALAFLPSLPALPKLKARPGRFPLAFAALWAAFPAIFLLAISLIKPVLIDRYMSLFVPGLVLLAAGGLARLRTRWQLPVTAIIVLLSLAAVRGYFAHAPLESEDWRGAVAYAARHAAPGDVTILNNGFARPVFEYYRQKEGSSAPRVFSSVPRSDELTYLDFEGIPNQRFVDHMAEAHDRVWMFDWNMNSDLAVLLDRRFHRKDAPKFTGLNVALYVRSDSHAP